MVTQITQIIVSVSISLWSLIAAIFIFLANLIFITLFTILLTRNRLIKINNKPFLPQILS